MKDGWFEPSDFCAYSDGLGCDHRTDYRCDGEYWSKRANATIKQQPFVVRCRAKNSWRSYRRGTTINPRLFEQSAHLVGIERVE